MGGAYGYEKVNYRLAQEIGSKLFEDIKDTPTDQVVTDCGGCKLQIEAGCGITVEHPIMLLYEACNLSTQKPLCLTRNDDQTSKGITMNT